MMKTDIYVYNAVITNYNTNNHNKFIIDIDNVGSQLNLEGILNLIHVRLYKQTVFSQERKGKETSTPKRLRC